MFKSLKDMIFEKEDTNADTNSAPSKATGVVPAATTADTPPIVSGDNSPDQTLDVPGITKTLDDMIHADPAFAPYTAFENIAESMKGVIPDEATRFKAAQAACANKSAEVLVAALMSHREVLTAQVAAFKTSFLDKAELEVSDLAAEASSVQQQIDELAKKVGELTQHRDQLIETSRAKSVSAKKAEIDFNNIVDGLGQKYTGLAEKVRQHLGN